MVIKYRENINRQNCECAHVHIAQVEYGLGGKAFLVSL